MKSEKYDLIGDIHGQAAILRDLLARLGYRRQGGGFRHPEGRRVIFLGDYIDRGPAIRETLRIIREMVEQGNALALCGNHELDALQYGMADGCGSWLRPHNESNTVMHARTLAEFADRADEWRDWLRWFQTLPLHLDLPGLRAVHACWDERQIAVLGDRRLDDGLLRATGDRGCELEKAVRQLLKGPEVPLPQGIHVAGRAGGALTSHRVRWWQDGRGQTYREACINRHGPGPDTPVPAKYDPVLFVPHDDQRPIFIGHYWLPPERPFPLTRAVTCLDYSVGSGGPLVAYRWDGERRVDPAKFVFDPARIGGGTGPAVEKARSVGARQA